MRDFNGEVESRDRRLLSCLQFSMFGQPVVIGSDAKHRAFRFGVESCSATARASSARLRQCSGSSNNAGIEILHSSKRLGTTRSWRRFGSDMLTPKEFRKNAADCLRLSRETSQIYAKLALIVMATEFRVMAEHLERDATRRTAERLRQRVHSLLRSHRYG
jgi:hypothetical protein